MWQSSPPGSIYDYIRVASFSIGPDGLIDQWSRRAAGCSAWPPTRRWAGTRSRPSCPRAALGRGHRGWRDPRRQGVDGPRPVPDPRARDEPAHGLAEVYVMPSETDEGERAALCIVVDVRALRRIETDLAASQAIFGQSPFGFVLFGTDFTVVRANQRFATVFGGAADDHRGRTVDDYLPGREADRLAATLRRVLETGDAVTDLQLVGTAPGTTGRRHWSMNLYRVHSGAGPPRRRRRPRHRRHPRGTSPPARPPAPAATSPCSTRPAPRIGNSLDLETTARELLDVAVPGFCDLASVDLYQGLLDRRGGLARQLGGTTGIRQRLAELRRVAHASAVSDALPIAAARQRPTARRPPPALGSVHRFPFHSPCAVALRTGRVEDVPGERRRRLRPVHARRADGRPRHRRRPRRSSPVPRAASPSASGTGRSPPNSPPAPPSVSTTPASTAGSTSAR